MTPRLRRIWAISETGLSRTLKKKAVILILFAAWAPTLIMGIAFFAMGSVLTQRDIPRDEQIKSKAVPRIALPVNLHALFSQLLGRVATEEIIRKRLDDLVPLFWRAAFYQHVWMGTWVLFFAILAVGPTLITPDLKTMSLHLYFSKPISKIDYFTGKSLIITSFVFMVILFPNLFLYILSVFFLDDYESIKTTIDIPLKLIILSFLYSFIICSVVNFIGSISKNSIYCMFLIIVASVGTGIFSSFSAWFYETYPSKTVDIKRHLLISIPVILDDLNVILIGVNEEIDKINNILRSEEIIDSVSGMIGRLGDMPKFGSGNSLKNTCIAYILFSFASIFMFFFNISNKSK